MLCNPSPPLPQYHFSSPCKLSCSEPQQTLLSVALQSSAIFLHFPPAVNDFPSFSFAALLTAHFTLHTAHLTLHTLHFTLHTRHSALHILHFTLYTPHSMAGERLYVTPHITLHAPHFTLYTYSTLQTLHFTLYTPQSTLCTPHSTQPSWPCMLATYSPRGPVCWQPTALMALYVGNPQPSWPCMLATYSTRSPVCWEEEEQRHLLLKATWQVRKKMRDLPIQALRWVRAGPAWRP